LELVEVGLGQCDTVAGGYRDCLARLDGNLARLAIGAGNAN